MSALTSPATASISLSMSTQSLHFSIASLGGARVGQITLLEILSYNWADKHEPGLYHGLYAVEMTYELHDEETS